MSDTLTVKTTGLPVMGEEQTNYFAISIFSDVKEYISEHRAEFDQWLKNQDSNP